MRKLIVPALMALLGGMMFAWAQQTAPDSVIGGIYNSSAPSLQNYQKAPLQMDSSGNTKVNVAAGGALTPSSDATASGSCTAACTSVSIPTNGVTTVLVSATGSGIGLTYAIQGQDQAGNWTTLPMFTVTTYGWPSISSTGTENAQTANYIVFTAGYQNVRVNLTVIGGGTETFSLRGSTALASGVAPPSVLWVTNGSNLFAVAGLSSQTAPGTSVSNSLATQAFSWANNGSTWDPWHNNNDLGSVVTVNGSDQTGATQTNYNGRGVLCYISITGITGGNIEFVLKARDNIDGVDFLMATTTPIGVAQTTTLQVYPGLATTAPNILNAVVPRFWHLDTVLNNNNMTVTGTNDCHTML